MDSRELLKKRPVEQDTKILAESMIEFKNFVGVYEKWSWEGVTASSVILLKKDVEDLSREELVKTIFEQMKLPVDPRYTYSERDSFVFINFGFHTRE